MMNETRKKIGLIIFLILAAGAPALAAEGDNPATLDLQIAPTAVAPGSPVQVVLRLTPNQGYKINKYPRISLKVAGIEGMVREASASVGSTSPPPPDKMNNNYFKEIDPITLNLELDPAIPSGTHTIPARLKYYYCVKASGYCAPKRTEVSIPVTVK